MRKKLWIHDIRFHTIKSIEQVGNQVDLKMVATAIALCINPKEDWWKSMRDDQSSIENQECKFENEIAGYFKRTYELATGYLTNSDEIALLNAELKARKYGFKKFGVIK